MKIKEHNLTLFELPFLLLYALLLAVCAAFCLVCLAVYKSFLLAYKVFNYTVKAKLLRMHVIGLGSIWSTYIV